MLSHGDATATGVLVKGVDPKLSLGVDSGGDEWNGKPVFEMVGGGMFMYFERSRWGITSDRSSFPENRGLTQSATFGDASPHTVDGWEVRDDDGQWIQVEDFGLGLYPFEFTKKNAPSTNEETLTKVKAMVEEEFTARGLKLEE